MKDFYQHFCQPHPISASCFAGCGSISSPAKEEQKRDSKTDEPAKCSPASDTAQEALDGRKAFESWLFEKLPFITAIELQVRGNRARRILLAVKF